MPDDPPRPPPAVTLRPVRPEDMDFLYELYAGTRRDEVAAWGLDEATLASLLRMQFEARYGAHRAQYPRADHHIILHEQRPVGRLYVNRTERDILLVDIALLPEVRGGGIGTYLLQGLLHEAAGRGVPVRLSVTLTNPARRLYDRLGFARLGDDGVYEQRVWHPPAAG